MNKKQLAIKLSKLKLLSKLDISLEQYQIDGNLAADLLWVAYQNGDIKNKVVADLGCGNGMLGIGALLLGAKFAYFLDLDINALKICKPNLENLGSGKVKLINSDVADFNFKVDTVVMNPPFGVQKRKADKIFLETAMGYAKKVYSIHKIESKNFIGQLCKENNFRVLDILEKKFIINRTYKFHIKNKYSFNVGIWILEKLLRP